MARAFDSTSKKLAIPLFALFGVGWIVFTVGFSLLLASPKDGDPLKEDSDKTSPLYYPYYMTLVGGKFVAVLGVLHAALPSGRRSSIISALSTILNIIYFVSVGYVVNSTYYRIENLKYNSYYNINPSHHDPQLIRAVTLMLAGSIILAVSWGLIQLLSIFYEHHGPQPVPARNLWHVFIEGVRNRTTIVSDVSESVRLSSIPAVLLSAVGWGVYAGGQHGMRWSDYNLFGQWSAIFVTPLMYLTALLYAGYAPGDARTLMRIFASILNTFFIMGMGFSVTFAANYLYSSPELLANSQDLEFKEEINNIYHYRLMLGGGMICLIFWTIVLVLWPFYRFRGISHNTNEVNNSNYDDDLLLPASPTEHAVTQSRENMPQPAHLDQYHTEAEATNNII